MPAPAHPASQDAVGRPLDRVDGRLKVTGAARYAAEFTADHAVIAAAPAAHAVLVQSTIARGTIESFDLAPAQAVPGVLAIITPQTIASIVKLRQPKNDFLNGGILGESRLPLSDMDVHYAGQDVAVVIADTPERAREAADKLLIRYAARPPVFGLDNPDAKVVRPEKSFGEELQVRRGDVDAALAGVNLTVVRQTYTIPVEHHNPMELSATVARWDAPDHLTVHDATQYIMGTRAILADAFGLPRERVRVTCPFVGGGFGCKGFQWPHTILAAVAAKAVGRPVRLVVSRTQMFTSCGHRPALRQALTLAAGPDARLVALRHDTTMHGSTVGEYVEACGLATSRLLYACPNLETPHAVKQVDVATPTPMRAPGECPGTFALESAMDELAYALKVDPIQLRLANHADTHPQTNKPWSSKHLKECYQLAADQFGWSRRNPAPRATRDDAGRLIGWGMATATYPGYRFPSAARIRLIADTSKPGGVRAVGSAATHDLGTGAYTAFTQITAHAVNLPTDRVTFELGDSTLPPAPVAGGSNSTASVGHALSLAAEALKANLARIVATLGDTPLKGLSPNQLVFASGTLAAKDDPSRSIPLADLVARSGRGGVEGVAHPPGNADPNQHATQAESGGNGKGGNGGGGGTDYDADQQRFAFQSFGCHFVEVAVDERLARVRVTRVVSAFDAGRIINPKTARSQIIGGVVMGLGMALMEATAYDPQTARPVSDSLADYAIPTNADVPPSIEPHFLDIPDPHMNALGCRGIGEIGITGVAAAVANAVYHATGKRVRDLPITPDKLL